MELESWKQFRCPQFCCCHPEHHSRSQPQVCLLFCIRPDQDVGLGRISVLVLFWGLLALTSTVNMSVLLSSVMMMAPRSSFFLLAVLFPGYLDCYHRRSVLGLGKVAGGGGDTRIFCGCGHGPASPSRPSEPPLGLQLCGFAGGGVCFFAFGAILMTKPNTLSYS